MSNYYKKHEQLIQFNSKQTCTEYLSIDSSYLFIYLFSSVISDYKMIVGIFLAIKYFINWNRIFFFPIQ